MEVCRKSSGLLLLLGLSLLASTLLGVQGEVELEGPSESECRPYIEKALKELETGDPKGSSETADSREDIPTVEITTDDSNDRPDGNEDEDDNDTNEDRNSKENAEEEPADHVTADEQEEDAKESKEDDDRNSENKEDDTSHEQQDQSVDDNKESEEANKEQPSKESEEDTKQEDDEKESVEQADGSNSQPNEPDSKESSDEKDETESKQDDQEDDKASGESKEDQINTNEENKEDDSVSNEKVSSMEGSESKEDEADTKEDDDKEDSQNKDDSVEQSTQETESDSKENEELNKEDENKDSKEDKGDSKDDDDDDSKANDNDSKADDDNDSKAKEDDGSKADDSKEDKEASDKSEDEHSIEKRDVESKNEEDDGDNESKEKAGESKEDSKEGKEKGTEEESKEGGDDKSDEKDGDDDKESGEGSDSVPEEELSVDTEVPTDLRPREHVEKLLKLDEESSETQKIINRVSEITLKELKKLYENAIKPLEVLYKYRDLSNRHFGDAEIFSKPLILFMGPWSGGKSSIINYLVNNEYNETSLKTGAEPSPAYFNILMYGEESEVIDGTELAADFTFSGLQKFGQGLEERLRGVKLPNKLLEKVNVVEIPGILEVRKQVSRVFPFNDACQWFIDRADIIFLVYDPSKLDVGPETEAILDQLKGREHQTRIVLNKADQVKPEELMRVQGALIWNISPLMSSPQPPIMYTTSLWSRPYEPWAPVRLLQAQERAFLRDLRGAIDKRIENKIASARRFAVRVRNHAKMVDCYLTTYYNHKSVFGNRKQVADEIIEHPQDYHIYEGLSTLTNISRYDLPDPEVYKDFFKLNPLYDFQQLSATCTYFRGCPINRLDVAIAYDLPELVGTHRKLVENALAEAESQPTTAPGS